mgnify:CR=1 FL=1
MTAVNDAIFSQGVSNRDDIVVNRPIPRRKLGSIESGYLANCNATDCQWQGLFPNPHLALSAVENHYDHAKRSGQYHHRRRYHTVVELLDAETATTLDESKLDADGIGPHRPVDDLREWEFPRATQPVDELVARGDRIELPANRTQKVRHVSESRANGLPVWSVGYCDIGSDLTSDDLPSRGQNELIAQNGEIYASFGPDPTAHPAFETVGRADHQANIEAFTNRSENHAE